MTNMTETEQTLSYCSNYGCSHGENEFSGTRLRTPGHPRSYFENPRTRQLAYEHNDGKHIYYSICLIHRTNEECNNEKVVVALLKKIA